MTVAKHQYTSSKLEDATSSNLNPPASLSSNRIKKSLDFFDRHKIESIPRYIELYNDYIKVNSISFKSKLEVIADYCQKFINKKEFLNRTLLSSLDKNELSYIKFSSTLNNIENNVTKNINAVLIQLHSFDEKEYEIILKYNKNSKYYQERMDIFNEYSKNIDDSIDFIDEILLKMDKLQLETAKMKSVDIIKIEQLNVISDIDNLINSIKHHKV